MDFYDQVCLLNKSIQTSDHKLFDEIVNKDSVCYNAGINQSKSQNIETIFFIQYSPLIIDSKSLLNKRKKFKCNKKDITILEKNKFLLLMPNKDSLIIEFSDALEKNKIINIQRKKYNSMKVNK